ncbi:MAG: phosphotransferase family protein, partial [Leucothrix sp.]
WQALIEKIVQDDVLRMAYDWEPLAKGSSNAIFLGRLRRSNELAVSTANHEQSQDLTCKVVLRINAPAKDTPGVYRQQEATILNWIQPYTWAPQILHNEPEQGWCLMRYYEGAVETETTTSQSLPTQYHDLLLNAVNELHAIEIQADNLITDYESFFDTTYLPIAKQRNDKQALEWLESIKNTLTTLPKLPARPVHHDLHRGNLVISAHSTENNTNHLTILDWEYAAIGNPWFDASCLSRYLSIPTNRIHNLTLFSTLKTSTFESALERANEMTKNLEKLWHRTRG